ncbi:MAG TPA: reductive dehalogenase domain-containing protein [Bacteroidales bacterium]|jgi:ferredoxin|nr:reductive dehalogenase domain-containing protein [Bacteroidales bacterium]|tara:strand:- start:7 stop:1377 length:1371 start_codon:yes stop_codon:yes gene_type:complete
MSISNFELLDLLLILSGIAIFVFFIYAAIVSLIEKEKKAASNFILIGLIAPVPFLLTGFYVFQYQPLVSIVLLSSIFILLMIYFLPIRFTSKVRDISPEGRIDERDIMFSRRKLEEDTENFKDYYSKNPDKLKIDSKINRNPGLLKPASGNYDPFMGSSADASFDTVDLLSPHVDGKISSRKISSNPNSITKYIKNWSKKLGALDVGITELKEYHKYSNRGRENNYGDKVVLDHKFAIAFTVEMNHMAIRSGPYYPTVMESAQQYLAAGAIAVQLAKFIRQLGFPARAHIDGNYELICPLVAKDAGLGEIGRMGILMTPKYGPRVRLAVVTTDIPLIVDSRSFAPDVIDFCDNCNKCAVNCPANAISYSNRKNINGVTRWQINQESCYDFWTKCGTDCGRCLSDCPYSHPNNLLHSIVRFGIRNSTIFSRIAMVLDDIIYGKKPAIQSPPDWMKVN